MGQPNCNLLMVACTHSWTEPIADYLAEFLPVPVRTFADALSGDFDLSLFNPKQVQVDWSALTNEQENALVAALPAIGGALRNVITSGEVAQ